jgi:hypothetical protein
LLPFATTLAILFFSTPTKYLKIYPPAEGCSKSFFAVDQQEHDAHGLVCCKAGAKAAHCAPMRLLAKQLGRGAAEKRVWGMRAPTVFWIRVGEEMKGRLKS